jgi:hypothetical protein
VCERERERERREERGYLARELGGGRRESKEARRNI